MRVTAQVKAQTRQRILDVARKLFADKGFHATSTRDLASAAALAAGTVFNYFPTKEDLAMTLMAEALDEAAAEFAARRRGEESLAEDLFAHIACGLRALRPFRDYAAEVFESALSPFSRAPAARVGAILGGASPARALVDPDRRRPGRVAGAATGGHTHRRLCAGRVG